MMQFLKSHPFAVEAYFDSSVVLSFAVPKEQLIHLIPPCLELDLLNEQYGFIAVAMVQTRKLRPKGFPAFMGNDFFLIGYRIFVRYKTSEGKRLRGLYILRSETDKKKMEWLGSLFTQYKYQTIDIKQQREKDIQLIQSDSSGLQVKFRRAEQEIPLPKQSPFTDWKEARRFAGPLPFTFSYLEREKKVLIVEGVRSNWTPKPVQVLEYKIPYLENIGVESPVLANAFEITEIPYYWKKGKKDSWR
ncbi:hypothetical protein GCM10027036_18760 [Flavihumibacter cheonanensis]|uniref:DUF2071 domain-containing protein n=1 Tax=Flavihumibacter cheonanensis TaxID=1442385 RepID=UPI001EF95D92|nr:DUF2071 domain-containing protein [Flavihumibacter cheonanensis]MCG7754011.1 DUF2071 domain-containing protein [Flavihumibacter cheonanensis]